MKKKLFRGVIALMTIICLTILSAFVVLADPPDDYESISKDTTYYGTDDSNSFLPTTISPKDTDPELTVEQTTDKNSYGATDSITVTLSVNNTSEHGSFAQKVKLSLETPDGYLLADGNKSETTLDALEAGETATLKTTFISKKANPKTGDNNTIFWIIGIFVISGGVLVLSIRSKRFRKTFLPIFIGFIAAGSLLAGTATKAFAGEDLSGKIEKSINVKVDNKDLTIKGLVSYDEWVVMPGKGDLVALDGPEAQFRVLKTNGTQAEVLAMEDGIKMAFNTESKSTQMYLPDGTPVSVQQYKDSDLDKYLNGNTEGCYYYGLSENIKNAIIPQDIDQCAYMWKSEESPYEKIYPYWTGYFMKSGQPYKYYMERPGLSENVGERNVYALDLADIMEYLGDENLAPDNLNQMFFNTMETDKTCWLRSTAYSMNPLYTYYVYGHDGVIDLQHHNLSEIRARGAFTIDLSKCAWDYLS